MQAIFLNTPELIEQHWPDVARLVAPVVEHAARGEFSVDDLGAFLTSEQAWAGLAVDEQGPALAMVFEFRHYPAKTVINIMAIGGRDLGQVAMTFWPQFLAWAKESGAAEIEASVSPAMARVLKNLGFQHTYDVVRCPT